jgi:hypothetical protein
METPVAPRVMIVLILLLYNHQENISYLVWKENSPPQTNFTVDGEELDAKFHAVFTSDMCIHYSFARLLAAIYITL